MYEEELQFLRDHEDPNEATNFERTKLSEQEISKLAVEFPGLPEDYLCYLKEVGWGSFRECQFEVFEPGSFLESALSGYEGAELNRYFAFGHNFSGDTSVFDTKEQFQVTEYWHSSSQFYNVQQSFKEYIRNCMLMDSRGNDKRSEA